MGHKDTTYVVFDGDNDYWAYARMKGWKALPNIDFDFQDAHDINRLRDYSNEETVKRKLRERFNYADQIVVLIGESTKNLYRYIRWELEVALNLGLPIIAVNLNGERSIDYNLCPPIIRDEDVIHISYNMRIIKYALDNFPSYFHDSEDELGPMYYSDDVYEDLEI